MSFEPFPTPLTDAFVAKNADVSILQRLQQQSQVRAWHTDNFSLFEALIAVRGPSSHGYSIEGIRGYYGHKYRKLTLARGKHDFFHHTFMEDDNGNFTGIPEGMRSRRRHPFGEFQKRMFETHDWEDFNDFLLFDFDYTSGFKPFFHLNRDLGDNWHDSILGYQNNFETDARNSFRGFISKLEPEALIPDDMQDFSSDVFNWNIDPKTTVEKERRSVALQQIGQMDFYLFQRKPLGINHRQLSALVGIKDISARIDAGEDVFDILESTYEIPADFIREKTPELSLTWATSNPTPANELRLQRLLPWLSLPSLKRSPTALWIWFGGNEQDELRNYSQTMKFIGEVAKEMGAVIDTDPNLSPAALMLTAHLLGEIFRPQLSRVLGQDGSQISWAAAKPELDRIRLNKNGAKEIIKEGIQALSQHLFVPTALIAMRRNGIADFTAENFKQAYALGQVCAFNMVYESQGHEITRLSEIRDICRTVEEFQDYAAKADPSAADDPIFKKLGFKLSDDDTQQGIFELYRDKVLHPKWKQCGTLTEFLIDSGLFRKLNPATAPQRTQPLLEAKVS